ncbi:MAG: nuclear transport factor 2 family protein [Ignavibacteria bacterium]
MKIKNLLLLLLIIFVSCQQKPEVDYNKEIQEVLQFLKDYSAFVNKNSVEDFKLYWRTEEGISYIPLEKDSAIVGFENVYNYFKKQTEEVSKIEYSSWNASVWINPTKSEAVLVFLSSKGLQFKNGFNLGFYPIRNSAVLSKFEGKWKLVSLHESVRQK